MQSHDFSKQLEKIVGKNSITSGINKIIIEAGFDCISALANIDQNSIKLIEEHVNENKGILKGTVYKNSVNFKLKPGHKAIILGIPNALKNYELKNKKIRVCPLDEETLKKKLVEKLTKFAEKFSYDLIFNVELISEFFKDKCRFKCPLCSTKIKCVYTHYWLISNLEKHIKSHYKRVQIIEIDTGNQVETIEQSEHSNTTTQVISYINTADQMNSLNDILEDSD